MGGSESERPDDGAGSVPGVPGVPSSENGSRLRAAETVAVRLGELLEDLVDELRALPRWRPATAKRREIERAAEVGLTFYYAWRDAFEPDAA